MLSLRHQLHYRLNLRPLVYSFLALTINGWKYFYTAFCTHKDFGTVRPLPTSVLEKDSLYHSAQNYKMAERSWQQESLRQLKKSHHYVTIEGIIN